MADLDDLIDAAANSPASAVAAGIGEAGAPPAAAGDQAGRGVRGLLSAFRPSVAVAGAPMAPLLLLAGVAFFDELDRNAVGILAPELRRFFGLDLASVTLLVSFTSIITLLLVVPVGYLSDRLNRTWLTAIGMGVLGLFGIASGLVPSLLVFAALRSASGMGRTAEPAHTSLLADYYPPETRTAVYTYRQLAAQFGRVVGPLLIGIIASFFVWQMAILAVALPGLLIGAVILLTLREPVRGEQERRAAGLSDEVAGTSERPPSFGESLRVAWSVRTLRRIIYALPFLVGAFIGIGTLLSLFYDEVFNVSTATRGLILSGNEVAAVVGLVVGGAVSTRLLRERPAWVIFYAGAAGVIAGLAFGIVALSPWMLMALVATWVAGFSLAVVGPASLALLSLVIPARARGLGLSLGAVAVIPGLLVTFIAGALGDKYGIRGGLLSLVPVFVLGAVIIGSASSSVAADIRAATAAAAAAQISQDARDQGRTKLLVCHDLDVHYGQVQILFNVDFEVEQGEIIALLGTNGAGKSTLLRAISGLTHPSNGAIFYDGENITHLPSYEHAARGIIQVPGGRGVFPTLTVAENLRVAAWMFRSDDAYVHEALEQVYGYFPILRERGDEAAGNLSGGEQQMLTLGQAFLSRPRLLMIDELSLGLAPAIVEQLLDIVRAIHDRGTTVILVEQSVNVALEVAQRAVFMEKGEIRFTGPTANLLARPDILRSVYIQGTRAARGNMAVGGSTAMLPDAGSGDRGQSDEGPVLEVHDLRKRYGGKVAVDGVSFTLAANQILGLIGPNGAGKTTIFDMVSGFVEPDSGEVLLYGDDVTAMGPDQRAGLGLLRSFQEARLFPALTVAENLAVALERHVQVRSATLAALHLPNVARSEARVRRRTDRLIEVLGLGSTRDKFVRELSTGQRRIVDMACVLAAEPRVLLLDEPSSGIAQREAEELGPLLIRIQQETGCSILIIEHDMPLIMSVSNELIALELGRVVTRGTPGEVVSDPRVVASYLGDSDEVVNRSGQRTAP